MILGLRTEDPKLMKAFKLVQRQAAKEGKVFFLKTTGDREESKDDLWPESMWGWLIPKELASTFNKIYQDEEGYRWLNSYDVIWWDYYERARREETENGFEYQFMNIPKDFRGLKLTEEEKKYIELCEYFGKEIIAELTEGEAIQGRLIDIENPYDVVPEYPMFIIRKNPDDNYLIGLYLNQIKAFKLA